MVLLLRVPIESTAFNENVASLGGERERCGLLVCGLLGVHDLRSWHERCRGGRRVAVTTDGTRVHALFMLLYFFSR